MPAPSFLVLVRVALMGHRKPAIPPENRTESWLPCGSRTRPSADIKRNDPITRGCLLQTAGAPGSQKLCLELASTTIQQQRLTSETGVESLEVSAHRQPCARLSLSLSTEVQNVQSAPRSTPHATTAHMRQTANLTLPQRTRHTS